MIAHCKYGASRLIRIGVCAIAGLFAALPAAAQSSGLHLPPVKKVQFSNGMTVWMVERHELPLVDFSVVIKAGSVADPAGNEGTASLTAALLRKGAGARTADQFSADLDFIGGRFAANAGADTTTLSAEFMSKDLTRGLELLSDALLHPAFPAEEFTKLQKQRLDAVHASRDSAQAVIGAYFNAYLYGNHPYARPVGGDENSLAAITRDSVEKFYAASYSPKNTILVVVGDFRAGAMEALLREKFGSWIAAGSRAENVAASAPFQGKKLLLVDKPDSTQTYFQIGNVGIARNNPDRIAIQLVNTLFGGRFTSMLNEELRVKTGLSYGASSSFTQMRAPGPFRMSSYTRNATTERALDLALATLARLHEQGVTAEELASAKNFVKGQFPDSVETSEQLGARLAELAYYGLDESELTEFAAKIDAVTLDDARRVIRQYFPQENLVFVVVGKASEIGSVVKKYAPHVDQVSISTPGFGAVPAAIAVVPRMRNH